MQQSRSVSDRRALFVLCPAIRIRCSPDHFVTLRFENHVFQDTDGRPSVKAGKEYVAKLALVYFFAGSTSNGTSSKANGSGLMLGNRERKDGPMRLDV